MKLKAIYISAALLLGATATSCRDEHLITEGEGRMMLETSIMSDVKVVSRALTAEQNEELCNKALIWISDPKKGLIYRYDGLAAFPQQGLPSPPATMPSRRGPATRCPLRGSINAIAAIRNSR